MKIEQDFSLKNHNTFGVDAKASYFVEVKDLKEIRDALDFAKEKQLRVLYLGGGSNVLFTKDFNGLVIALQLKGISVEKDGENHVLVSAQAGENWHQFVLYCLEQNFGGLENLSLIPGNVGTSPIQNIGAYGVEIKDVFSSCKVLDIAAGEIKTFDAATCRFGYRDSIFKHEGKGKYIILEVTFRLTTQEHKITTEYGAIQAELQKMNVEMPTIKDVSNAVVEIRQSKLPDPKMLGNAGSFFKNPTIPAGQFSELKTIFPEIPGYPNVEKVKVPAGWLIENAGWKGRTIGNVGSHELQALVLVNKTGTATGKEIFDFSTKIIDSVKEKFGIALEREVNII